MINDLRTQVSGGPEDVRLKDQIERSQTLSALASYFHYWMPEDRSLYYLPPEPKVCPKDTEYEDSNE